ncbi:MAG: hypothetical protein ACRYG8_23720 [Janthinobacterium lividum]
MNRMLGKLPAIFPSNAPRMDGQKLMARQAPPKLIRTHIDPGPQMDRNDQLGDCTAAGIANAARAQARLGGYTIGIPTEKTVAFYSQSTGYDPTNANSDQGGVEVSVLASAARDGFDTGGETKLYPLWGSIDKGDLNGVRLVCAEIGPVYLGVSLAFADQADGVWDTTMGGDQTPGSWGGHCLLLWDYDGTDPDSLVSLITWGAATQKATWRWLQSRMDEAHALSFRQLRKAGAHSIDYDTWEADCSSYLQSA